MYHDAADTRGTTGLSTGLGLFSLGLGAAEIAAPQHLARLIGLREDPRTISLLRVMGTREIVSGLAILNQPDRSAPLWSRLGGDLIDLAALGSALSSGDHDRPRLLAATGAVFGVAVLDFVCARRLQRADGALAEPAEPTVESITIRKPADELYRVWRDFARLPQFMHLLERVETLDARRSRWTARGPAGVRVRWDAEIVEDREGEGIAWRSSPRSHVSTEGRVTFAPAPAGRGTEVRVSLTYTPPAGRLGQGLAWLTGSTPAQQLRDDLRRFKQLMETGDLTRSDGPGLWRAAQPAGQPDAARRHAEVGR